MSSSSFSLASGGSAWVSESKIEYMRPDGQLAASFNRADIIAIRRTDQLLTLQHRTSGAIEVTLATVDEAAAFESVLRSRPTEAINVPVIVETGESQPASGVVRSTIATSDEIVRAEISKVLMPDEEIVAVAHQDSRAPTVKKAAVIVTSHRLIMFRPTMVGSFNFWDARWHDIVDVHLKQGMMFSDLLVRTVGSEVISIDKLNKEQARQIYSLCQQQEHKWKELRRERKMEEDRAKAGGVTINQGFVPSLSPQPSPVQLPPEAAASVAAPSSTVDDPVVKLQRAKQMLDAGLISESEYADVKQRVLATM